MLYGGYPGVSGHSYQPIVQQTHRPTTHSHDQMEHMRQYAASYLQYCIQEVPLPDDTFIVEIRTHSGSSERARTIPLWCCYFMETTSKDKRNW
jgi:hypothetical protein